MNELYHNNANGWSHSIHCLLEKYKELKEKNINQIGTIALSLDKYYIIILFGSRARSDYRESSDLDIIFVGDFKEPFIKRSSIILNKSKQVRDLIFQNSFDNNISHLLSMLQQG